MSRIQVAGNITEPELRFDKNGDPIVKFGLCEVRLKDGEKINTWYNVVVFGKAGENLVASSLKGRRLMVAGRLESDDYTTKDGEKRSSMQLIADEIALSMKWDPITSAETSAGASKNDYQSDEEPF